jgi:Dyp-type peroxidase family
MSEPLEKQDIQSLVLTGFPEHDHACFVLLSVVDRERARHWVRRLAKVVSTTAERPKQGVVNVAFSAAGLRALGLPDDALATFQGEFQEGMSGQATAEPKAPGSAAATSHRSRILGDIGPSDPATWDWGGPARPAVHAILLLYGTSEAQLAELLAAQRADYQDGPTLAELYVRETFRLPERREHFGFADGIAQPDVAGSGASSKKDGVAPAVKAGEFVLGYENEYGKLTPSPTLDPALDSAAQLAPAADGRRDFGRNGTYVVVRQLAQNVELFWRTMDQQSRTPSGKTDREGAIHLAAKCVGRWPSGAPLARSPDKDDPQLGADNTFGYADDSAGLRCPIASHIRRSNPRDSLEPDPEESVVVVNRHRILRRGRSYGPPLAPFEPDTQPAERGLFFICVNSNIRRQFEFIQQTWLNNAKFDGLYRDKDPIVGDAAEEDGGGTFTIPAAPERRQLTGLPRFVTVRGGEYFFLPSVRALKALGQLGG